MGRLKWTKSGFMLIASKIIRIFSDDGILEAKIDFKNKIFDAFLDKEKLKVMTLHKDHIFHFQKCN